MAKRDHACGRAAGCVEPTVSLESCEHLLSLIDEGRHGMLLADLARLRAGCIDIDDPLIRNMLGSLHHLGMAWGCCLDGGGRRDRGVGNVERERVLRRQLRSLCCSLLELVEQTVPTVGVARGPAAGHALTAFVGSLFNVFGGQVLGSPKRQAIAAAADPEADHPESDAGANGAAALMSHGGTGTEAAASCSMSVYFFGSFRVRLDGAFIEEWRNTKSKLILKYLVAHKERAIAKDYLMELFWPNTEPECARNNLNVAIYNIRQALKQNGRKMRSIFYKDGHYCLNPDVSIWTDLDAFVDIVDRADAFAKAGDTAKEASTLASLDDLYGGDFLEEDRFEDWVMPLRQRFKDMYWESLNMRADYYFSRHRYKQSLDMFKKMQLIDACDEQVHVRIMTCHARLGQHHLAMRQFDKCVDALSRELDIVPDTATVDLFERIRRREIV